MQEIRMTLYMLPVAKGRPRFNRYTGSTYTPKKTEIAERNIAAQAVQFRPATPLQERAHVALVFHMPVPKSMRKRDLATVHAGDDPTSSLFLPHTKKPDLDNLEKAVLDALNGIFWRDDSIIYSVHKIKKYGLRPRIEVFIQGE